MFSPDPAALRPWHPDHFTHAYGALAKPLGIATPLRNLRHFNATQLLTSGVDLRTVAGRLGHSDGGATTMRVYAHWVRPADQRAAELVAQELHQLRQEAVTAGGPAGLLAPVPVLFTARATSKPIEELVAEPDAQVEAPPATSPYRRIAAELRAAVATGRLAPGDVVPSVVELARWFEVSHGTAQRAIALLAAEGVLVVRSGSRTLVAASCGQRAEPSLHPPRHRARARA